MPHTVVQVVHCMAPRRAIYMGHDGTSKAILIQPPEYSRKALSQITCKFLRRRMLELSAI